MHNSNHMTGKIKKNMNVLGQNLLHIQRMFSCKKRAKQAKFCASGARIEASAGHIWPTGRMLCMPGW
jgi:hypothetical protein